MMHSMTGFGRATIKHENISISFEIRALNAKQTDIRFKLPVSYKPFEQSLKNKISAATKRGKIEVNIERLDFAGIDTEQNIDVATFKKFYQQLSSIVPDANQNPSQLISAILRLPNVVGTTQLNIAESEVMAIEKGLDEAITDFLSYRATEGMALFEDLKKNLNEIQKTLPLIEAFEKKRATKLRNRLENLIAENINANAVDQNRLEQEVIYYLEKIDIAEEKARLKQHCDFFLEKLNDDEIEKGRRLSFVTQEIGREINTLGAKAYSADIQKLVVSMKESVEKIKEQLANAV